jgi:hypothetical protein
MAKRKRITNYIQNTTQKTKVRATRDPLKQEITKYTTRKYRRSPLL